MRNILILTAMLLSLWSSAQRGYYVNSAGNDSNTGTILSPYRTVARARTAMASMVSGDSILLNSGNVFTDTLTLTKGGLYIGKYGSGDRPEITTFQTSVSWTLHSGNIYYTTVNTTTNSLRMVLIDNIPAEMGRYPNSDSANGGWLIYEDTLGINTIFDNQLTSLPNWTGADIVVRKNHWTSERLLITSHLSTKLVYSPSDYFVNGNYGNGLPARATKNFGYYFQNDIRTLNRHTEWFFDKSTKRLYVYFQSGVPSGYTVKVATKDIAINCSNMQGTKIENINFSGTNKSAIYSKINTATTNGLTVNNCDFSFIGWDAVQAHQSKNVIIYNCNAYWCLDNGFSIYNGNDTYSGASITHCSAKNIGLYNGLAPVNDISSQTGIYIAGGSGGYCAYNFTDTTGRDGIRFFGSNVIVEKNVVHYFDISNDDQGGIYTFSDGTDAKPPSTTTVNRIVRYNKVTRGVGAPFGANTLSNSSNGIYIDGRPFNVECYGNYTDSIPLRHYANNNPHNVYIHDNLIVTNTFGVSSNDWNYSNVVNFRITNNTFYVKGSGIPIRYNNLSVLAGAEQSTLMATGLCDSNYYNLPTGSWWQYLANGTNNRNISQWQSYSSFDNKSKFIPNSTYYHNFNTTMSDIIVDLHDYKDRGGNQLSASQVIPSFRFIFAYYSPLGTLPTTPSNKFRGIKFKNQ